MWPYWRESSHTVDIQWLLHRLGSITLTVGEAEAGSHVTFRDSCVEVSNKEGGADRETQPSHSNCLPASSGPAANLFAFQVFWGIHEECLLTKPPCIFSLSLCAAPVSLNAASIQCRKVQALFWAPLEVMLV